MFVSEYGIAIRGTPPPEEIHRDNAKKAFQTYAQCRDNAAVALGRAHTYTPGVTSHDKHLKRSWAWDELGDLWYGRILQFLEALGRADYPDPEPMGD